MRSVESVPLRTTSPAITAEQLGLVRYWANDSELASAEETALLGLQSQAATAGATAVVDLRVEVTAEARLNSRSPLLGRLVYMDSSTHWLVYAYGTAIKETSR